MKSLLIAAAATLVSFSAQAKLNVVTMPLTGTSNVVSIYQSATPALQAVIVGTTDGANQCVIGAPLIAQMETSQSEIVRSLQMLSTSADSYLMSCYTENDVVTQVVITESK